MYVFVRFSTQEIWELVRELPACPQGNGELLCLPQCFRLRCFVKINHSIAALPAMRTGAAAEGANRAEALATSQFAAAQHCAAWHCHVLPVVCTGSSTFPCCWGPTIFQAFVLQVRLGNSDGQGLPKHSQAKKKLRMLKALPSGCHTRAGVFFWFCGHLAF